jgi:ribonuclease VapC
LLDSFAILALLKKEADYQLVVRFLEEANQGKRVLLMNQINAGEVYYQVLKRNLTNDFNKFWKTFLMLPITFIPNDFDLVIEAARIKSRHAISYADCFAAATALRENASLVTGDPEFRKIEGEVKVEWI